MGQRFRDDKIGALSYGGGIVSLAPSYLTIGGQQYKTSTLALTVSSLTANTRYQIYAVLSSGVVTLVQSSNENSVGPTGHVKWKLVGSFYASGETTPAFGSFVRISGIPSTEEIPFTMAITGSGGNPSLGTTSKNNARWKRIGNRIQIFYDLIQTAAGTAGTGQYFFGIPSSFSVDSSWGSNGNFVSNHCGTFSINASAVSTRMGYMSITGAAALSGCTYGGDILAAAFSPLSNASFTLSFNAEMPISSFTNTAIEDL